MTVSKFSYFGPLTSYKLYIQYEMKYFGNKPVLFFLVLLMFSFVMCKNQEEADTQEVKPEPELVTKAKELPCKVKVAPGVMLPLITETICELDSLFTAAMNDAINPEPDEVYTELVSLSNNPNLIDTIINGLRYIKMVSWKRDASYFPESGKYKNAWGPIWVTAAPFVKDSCISYFKNDKDPNMRLRQLLGLQPFTIENVFVELWVQQKDMFRPCPDNETTDTKCDLNLPNTVDATYRSWFNKTRSVQYVDCADSTFGLAGYPWTQLGYTYDWSPKNPTNIGLSEFVIRKDSDMFVSGIYTTKQYSQLKPGR